MIFILSSILTSIVGYFIIYRWRKSFGLTERICISIFVGWGFFTNLIMFFSNNFSTIDLNASILLSLIIFSLLLAITIFVITNKKFKRFSLKRFIDYVKKLKFSNLNLRKYSLKSKHYLIIPFIFLALILLSIIIDTFWYKIYAVDPIFQWDQRAELIFLEKSVSGAQSHLFGSYPLHTPILHSWAYFFNFNNARIFYLISLMGLLAILMQNIYRYSKSMYCALIFSMLVIPFQIYYTKMNYAEGIANVYFFLGALFTLKYLMHKNTAFILLGSFFMAMHANTRPEGVLYWLILLLFIATASLIRKMLIVKHIGYYILTFLIVYYVPKSDFKGILFLVGLLFFVSLVRLLRKMGKIKYVGYGILTLIAFLFVFKGSSNIIMHIKIVVKCLFEVCCSWGELYKNKILLSQYFSNTYCCAIISFFAFWDSFFFDPQKIHVYNLLRVFANIIKQLGLNFWILLILVLGSLFKNREAIIRFFILIIFPIVCFLILYNYLQISFYYSPGVINHIIESTFKRYSSSIFICLIFFLSTNKFIKEIFTKIEQKKTLAYLLNLPFLYILLKQIWKIILIH